jgi:hypothetical protein
LHPGVLEPAQRRGCLGCGEGVGLGEAVGVGVGAGVVGVDVCDGEPGGVEVGDVGVVDEVVVGEGLRVDDGARVRAPSA